MERLRHPVERASGRDSDESTEMLFDPASVRFSGPSVFSTARVLPRKPVPSTSSYEGYNPVEEQQPPSYLRYSSSGHQDPPRDSLETQYKFTAWAFELAMLVISLLSFATIITVLTIEDGRKLSSWKFYFSLNTVIAALGTLWRAASTFGVGACLGQLKWNWISKRSDEIRIFSKLDAASKGPWGSFRMLSSWRRGIMRSWAVIGVLAILLAVITDPFFQESVAYTGRLDISTDTNLSSTIGRVDDLRKGDIVSGESTASPPTDPSSPYPGTTFWGFSTQANLALASSLYGGFDHNNSMRPASNVCTTGNCSWPLYHSLAVCSSCHDVSDGIVTWKGEWDDSTGQQDATDNYIDMGYIFSHEFTNYSLSYGHMKYFNELGFTSEDQYSTGLSQTNVLLTFNATTDYRQTVANKDADTMLVAFLVMRAGTEYLTQGARWNESKPTATECAMSLCINTYNSTSDHGELADIVRDSWAQREPKSYRASDWTGLPHNLGPDEDLQKWDNDQRSLSHQGYYDRLLRTDLQLILPAEKNPMSGSEARFNVSQATIASLQDILLSWAVDAIDGNNSVVVYPYYGIGTKVISPLAEILWNSTDLDETFSSFAQSLTNGIRNTNVSFSGDAVQYQTYIHVQWPYLALPIFVAVCGTIFITAIVVQTGRSHLPPWKDDLAPVLAFGLPSQDQQALKSAYASTGADSSWKMAEVMQLEFDPRKGLRLRQTAGHIPLTSL